jgi:uncharacterized delta-60 repeat protein
MSAISGISWFYLTTPVFRRIRISSRLAARSFCLLSWIMSGLGGALAASGDFDVSFGSSGLAGLNIVPNASPGIGSDRANAMAVQSDDKIIAAGSTYNGYLGVFALVRHSKDGPLDPSFGGDGKVVTRFGSLSASANAMALQADGRIVAAGACGTDFAVARYLANGALDTTFSDDGLTTTSMSSGNDIARAVASQPDGKIVVAGSSSEGSENFAVLRYLADGNLDPAFGSGGKVTFRFSGLRSKGEGIAIQPDGKILICGGIESNANFGVARLNANGSMDPTFGTNGLVSTSIGAYTDYAKALALQPDGKIVVGGYSQTGAFSSIYKFAICRFNANGSLDTSFGSNGIQTAAVGVWTEEIRSLIVQADGNILAVGMAMTGSIGAYKRKNGMARFLANGVLDPSFGNGGVVISGDATVHEESFGAGLQASGQIVVAGSHGTINGSSDFVARRYSAQGSISAFGAANQFGVITAISGGEDIPVGMAVASDGKIFVAGTTNTGAGTTGAPQGHDFAVVRLNADGSPDLTFSGDGTQTTSIASGASTDKAAAMVLQPDGKLIVAGSASNGTTTTGALVRYLSNGNLDTTFGGTGKVMPSGTGFTAMALQADGKIITAKVVLVVFDNLSTTDTIISRHLANGSLDTSFDGDGNAQISLDNYNYEHIHGIIVQPDGKIVIAGDNSYSLVLARLNSNGSLDTAFDGDGKLTASFGGNFYSSANAVALQPDGKIVVAGSTANANSILRFGLARFMPDGSADATFGTGGKVTTTISSLGNGFNDLRIQSDGKLVAGGWVGGGEARYFVLARYRPDGSLDTSFHGNGWTTAVPGSGESEIVGIGLQPNGAIITAGAVLGEYDYNFAITRVEAGPEITVEQSAGAGIPSGGSVGFGVVTAGASKSIDFVVRNLGSSALNLSNPVIQGTNQSDFGVTAFSSSVLAPGASASFTITFAATGSGDRSALIRLSSDDDDEANYDITVAGTANMAPVFVAYAANTAFQSAIILGNAKLLTRTSDPEGDVVNLTGVDPASAGGGTLQIQASGIVYSPPLGFSGPDSFNLQITDSRGAVATGTVSVTVAPNVSSGGPTSNPPRITMLPGGTIKLKFQGIPGRAYQIQRSADMESWTTITTTLASPIGAIEFDDDNPLQPSGFYQLAAP